MTKLWPVNKCSNSTVSKFLDSFKTNCKFVEFDSLISEKWPLLVTGSLIGEWKGTITCNGVDQPLDVRLGIVNNDTDILRGYLMYANTVQRLFGSVTASGSVITSPAVINQNAIGLRGKLDAAGTQIDGDASGGSNCTRFHLERQNTSERACTV